MYRKKIIYVWKSPYPWDIRVEKICNSLAKEYDVLILARWGGETEKEEQIGDITVRRVGFQKKSAYSTPLSFNPIWKSELKKAIKGFKPDLIIVREIMLGTLIGKLEKKHNIPTIMDMAENYPALMKIWHKYNNSVLKRFLMRALKVPDWVEKSSIMYLSGIIVVCEEQIERLDNLYNFPKEKIAVVKNTPFISNLQKSTIKQQNKITFLHHGWLTEEKKIDIFIKTFVKLYSNNNDYELIVAGGGNCLEEYKELAKGTKNIQFTGEYSYVELTELISKCSIGVLPYEENDFNNYTIHNKLFDYFALSKPVLVSKAKPNARIVKETNSGLIVDCSSVQTLTGYLKGEQFANLEELGENAHNAYITKYNWSEDEKTLLQFVKEVSNNV